VPLIADVQVRIDATDFSGFPDATVVRAPAEAVTLEAESERRRLLSRSALR
jgi:hypothetical protein